MSESNGTNESGTLLKPRRFGRPRFPRSPRLEMLILSRLAAGESLIAITRRKRYPSYRTVMEWVATDQDFAQRYTDFRQLQAERMADELREIADDGRNDTQVDEKGRRFVDFDHINRSRLRVDTRKWIAAKLLPKKYGERPAETNVQVSVAVMNTAELTDLQERRKRAELAAEPKQIEEGT